MATIFEKSSSDKCLILEPREALVYPFDIKNWNEIRVSFALSFVSLSGNNDYVSSVINQYSASTKNSLCIGLYSGDPTLYPINLGSAFVGFGNATGTLLNMRAGDTYYSTYASLMINDPFGPGGYGGPYALMSGYSAVNNTYVMNGYGNSNTPDDYTYFNVGNGVLTNPNVFFDPSSASSFCVIETMVFKVINRGMAGQSFSLGWSNNGATPKTDTSISALVGTNQGFSPSLFGGLYYNSDCSSTGSPIDLPDKLFMSFPFANNRARIHSLLIEKYA